MVDNITLDPGSGGAVLATDDISAVHYQIIKLAFGALETATLVSTSNALPVDLRTDNLAGNLDVNIAASGATVTVSGTVTANAGTGTMTVTDDGSFTLAANSGVDIGDVDVLSVVPGTGATNLGKAVDAVAGASDSGVAALGVRDDTLATLTPVDGDYVRLRTNNRGAMWVIPDGDVNIADGGNSITVDGSVTLNANTGVDIGDVDVTSLIPGTGATNLGKAIDTAAGGTDTGVAALVIRDDALTTLTPIDGDYVSLRVGSTGALHVVHAGDINIADGGNTITVDGTVTLGANSGVDIGDVDVISLTPGTASGNLGKAEDAAHTTGDTGVMMLGVRRDADTSLVGADNDYAPFQLNATGALKVEIFDGGDALTIAQATASSLNAQVVGDVAHDGADSGNPVKIGGVARTANPTAVAGGDRVDSYYDDNGRQVIQPYAPRDLTGKQHTTITSSTAETTIVTAGGAGVFRDISSFVFSNESATECRVDVADATAGADIMSIDLAPDGGGAVMTFPVPIPQATANNNWTATCSASVASIYVTAVFVETN